MNPYQIMGVIACCVSIFAGVVTFLTVQGVPLPMAFLSVYLAAVWGMLGMQRRARESYGCDEHPRRRHREPSLREAHAMDDPVVVSIAARGIVPLHEPMSAHPASDPRHASARAETSHASSVRRGTFRA